MLGYTELACFKTEAGSPCSKELDQVLKAGGRAKKLVQQILSFSRQKEQEKRPILIAPIIKEAITLLRASLPATIQISQDVHSDAGAAVADSTEIHQLVMNLCTNAAHAMSESGGVLSVTLERVYLDEETAARIVDLNPGSYLRLAVSDTGEGMNQETQSRIFDPFFTTKERGEGTGMGLAVVHSIVKRHGGAISVYSEPGHGSTFRIYLPRLVTQEEDQPPSAALDLPLGREHILLVDDEEALVDTGKRILERLGYQVTTRLSSAEALGLFRDDPQRYDLIITDQTMPQMTGLQLAEEIQLIRPGVPIILCTGFSKQVSSEKMKKAGIRHLAMKPLLSREIAFAAREALDGDKARAASGLSGDCSE
jgi:CheY-like chemotaxis protein